MPRHVSLLVDFKDAQKIQLAKRSGSLSLSLRGDNDSESIGSETVTLENLFKNSRVIDPTQVEGTMRIGDKTYDIIGGRLEERKPEADQES